MFQSVRPVPEGLERLYANFAGTVAKVTPTSETAVEYFLAENSKDYVQMPAKALKFLDEHGRSSCGRTAAGYWPSSASGASHTSRAATSRSSTGSWPSGCSGSRT